jgi:mono/diheme cytochrome c family protein
MFHSAHDGINLNTAPRQAVLCRVLVRHREWNCADSEAVPHQYPNFMNIRRILRLSAAAALVVGLGVYAAPATHAAESAGTQTGKYVALAADCASCHTAPNGAAFAGGNPLKSVFGTIYGPNITSDVETGIGSWSKADFERALRQGIRKDGSYLYPAMPYGSYTKMSAADMDALWNYIHAIPAVHNTPPANTLPFPLTIRSGMAVWQSLYFKPGPFVPVASQSAEWNRGAYLVNALGHCGDCHTPRNLAQGLEAQHTMAGAQIEGWFAPDISNDTLSKIATWSVPTLQKYLKTGVAPGNVKSFGPMQEAIDDSLKHLSNSDLHAIAVYLKNQQIAVTPEKATPARLPADSLIAGKHLYEDNCSSCHMANGKGIPGTAPALAGNDAVTAGEPYNLIMAMLEGFPPQGTWGAMNSFAKALNDDQIADIANYVRTAWGNDAPPNAAPWSVGNWRKNASDAQVRPSAMLCPDLAEDVMEPALAAGPSALKQAALSDAGMNSLVSGYLTARPKASTAQTIEALSTAYCRTVNGDKLSEARMSAQIADFAQKVAVSVGNRKRST